MRLSSLILGLLVSLTPLLVAACVGDSGEDPPPVDDGDDGTGGDNGGGDNGGGDNGGGDNGGGGGDDMPGAPDGGTPAQACAAPGAVGNAGGVGEYCTEGGGECDDNDSATYCTVDYQSDAPPFCTMPCFSADACGENASCTDDGGGGLKGCVPSCVTEGGA